MRALHRKMFRDLWTLRTQSLAIAAVVATGVAMVVMYASTFASLDGAQTTFYAKQRFAHVFASCKRAPLPLVSRIASLSDVTAVSARIVVDVTLDLEAVPAPARGRLVSLPPGGDAHVNAVVLRSGRMPDRDALDDVLVHERFASEHDLQPGDRVGALVNGRRRDLRIAGIALSPEYVYMIGPGDVIPDPKQFGVFWMSRNSLEAAFDMEGAFNEVSVRLAPGLADNEPSIRRVQDQIDQLLTPYGGLGAIRRRHHPSHWFVENELKELKTLASIIPVIFLSVAAFLVNIVLSRLISLHRTQIAVLKAVGYSRNAVGAHYLGLAASISVLGCGVGVFIGARMGSGLTSIYAVYFRFPEFVFSLPPSTAIAASAVGTAAAILGAIGAVRTVNALPPAEAMRPEPPARFSRTWIEDLAPNSILGPSGRMTLRNIARRPWRFVLSSCGVALAVALLILGSFFIDAIDRMMTLHFEVARPHDMTVLFEGPRSTRVRHEMSRLPGVVTAEPFRAVPATLKHENASRRTVLMGLERDSRLVRIVDRDRGPLPLREDGLVLSEALAEELGVSAGDEIRVEVLEGERARESVAVASVVKDSLGMSAYAELELLSNLLREPRAFSGANLTIDRSQAAELFRRLKELPGIAGVSSNRAALQNLKDTIRSNMMRIIVFNVGFAIVIAFGVVYNAARISLSEHARNFASLRVLGFGRSEVSSILMREIAAITLVAIPIGLAAGTGLAWLTLELLRNELYRVPFVIDPSTYGFAVTVVVIAALVSSMIVSRRVSRLDLIEALKTRD